MVRAAGGGGVPFYCPVNEINYWAWGGGDHARMYPHAVGRGPELKRQLARAAIVAIEAVRSVEPRARFIQAEPLIHVTTPPDAPEADVVGAAEHREAQFEAFDMIAGLLAPELGGSEAHLDIVGVNFYPENSCSGPAIRSRSATGYTDRSAVSSRTCMPATDAPCS